MSEQLEKSNVVQLRPDQRIDKEGCRRVKADTDNGYTRFAHELLEAKYSAMLPGRAGDVFSCIIRKTYGYHKKTDWLSPRQVAENMGLVWPEMPADEQTVMLKNIRNVIKSLADLNMLVKEGKEIGPNPVISEWLPTPQKMKRIEQRDQHLIALKNKSNDLNKTPKRLKKITHLTYINNPTKDIKDIKETKDIAKGQISDKSDAIVKIPNCPIEDIVNIYHEELPELPGVKLLNPDRKKKLAARWKQDAKFQTVEFWREYFRYVKTSDFLMGQKGGFSASFDWLINSANFVKVIEGNYDNRGDQS